MKMIFILKIKNICFCIFMCSGVSSLEGFKVEVRMIVDLFEFVIVDNRKFIRY